MVCSLPATFGDFECEVAVSEPASSVVVIMADVLPADVDVEGIGVLRARMAEILLTCKVSIFAPQGLEAPGAPS
jgi:hypothetical protein